MTDMFKLETSVKGEVRYEGRAGKQRERRGP